MIAFTNATLVLPDRLVKNGSLVAENGRILLAGIGVPVPPQAKVFDCGGKYLSPGFVEVHVHGGLGADFMDLSVEAFRKVAKCHAKHGTTSMTPTSTTGPIADSFRFLDICKELQGTAEGGARILGGHL